MNNKQKALIFVLLASLFGGAAQPVIKVGLTSIPPFSFAFLRFLIAGLIILPFLINKGFLKAFWNLIPLSILGTFNIMLALLGVQRTSATIGQLLYGGVPLLTALFLFVLFKERLSKNKEIGILIGFLGVIGVVLLPILEKGNRFSGDFLGNIFIFSGVISWSLYIVYSQRALKVFSPLVVTAAFIWTTCLFALPFFLLELTSHPGWWNSSTQASVLSIGYSSIFTTVATFLLTEYAIKFGGPILASLKFYLLPIVAYFAAFFLLGERLTIGLVVGGFIVLLGIYITTKK